MPIFTVTLTETLTHRITVEATVDAEAMKAAEVFLTEHDHSDRYLLSTSGFEATSAEPAPPDAQPDLIAEDGE